MRVLGISALYHDSAASLVEDGRILSAAQEERFTRKKHDSRFPVNAIACSILRHSASIAAPRELLIWVSMHVNTPT